MKFTVYTILLFCLLATTAVHAQDKVRPYFLILHNGEIVQADKIQLKSPVFKTNYFLVNDTLKYNPAMVNAFQNEGGYYARIEPGNNYDSFAKRLLDGPRIDKFATSRDFYDYNTGYNPYGYGYGYGMPRTSRRRINFFSKDDGPLYVLNYPNLMEALADNEASMALLKKYKQEKLINSGVSIVGAGLLLVGSYLSIERNSPQQASTLQLSPMVYAGAGILGAQFVFNLFQKDKFTQAMEVYNYQRRE
jgi:hypothetical protein